MADSMGTPLAAVAYLMASGASRLEATQVVERLYARAVPSSLTLALDVLDSELLAIRSGG